MKNFTLTMIGTAPMLVHNAQLSDPLNKWAKDMKKVSAKRTKTEDDHLEMSRLEFYGGMYYDADLGPVIPAMNIEATLVNGAKKIKLGKAVTQGLRITDQVTPIAYKGPRDMEALWDNGESEFISRASVKVGMARVMRTRPMFNNWALEVSASTTSPSSTRTSSTKSVSTPAPSSGSETGGPATERSPTN